VAAVLPYIQLEPFAVEIAMRRSLLLSALLLALPALAHAQDGQRPEVTAAAQRLQAKVVEWRRDFHQHPELSNREARTSAEVAKRLRAMGLKPKTGIAHHGVVAIIEGGKPGRRSPCAPTWTRCR
jgi:amidohydrolase